MSKKGKLIAFYSPIAHGTGTSTCALATAIMLNQLTGKSTLFINQSGFFSPVEKYLSAEIQGSYTVDFIRDFGSPSKENFAFSNRINESLFFLSGSLKGDKSSPCDEALCKAALEHFDFVVVDLPSGVRSSLNIHAQFADVLVPVITTDEVHLENLFHDPHYTRQKTFIQQHRDKLIWLINKFPPGEDVVKGMTRISNLFGLDRAVGATFDKDLLVWASQKKMFYTFCVEQQRKNEYLHYVSELTRLLLESLNVGVTKTVVKEVPFYKRLLRRGGFDKNVLAE